MSERFIKFIPSEETDYLQEKHPNAFLLLTLIAKRARINPGHPDGLNIGEAHIGDFKKAGIETRDKYRTALKVLIQRKHIEIIETCRFIKNAPTGIPTHGTKVKLLTSSIWDVNFNKDPHYHPHSIPTPPPPHPHEQECKDTTSKEVVKKERAQSAARLRSKDFLSFNFSLSQFEGISEKDKSDWKNIYPHVDLGVELSKMTQWILANPSKGNKKLWRKFITGWLGRANDAKENKKAFGSAGAQRERRTLDINGNPVDSPHKGRF